MKYSKIPVFDIVVSDSQILGVDAIALVENPAIEEDFIALNKVEEIKLSIDEERKILTGPALVPDKLIYRVDSLGNEYYIRFSSQVIAQIVERYFAKNKHINFNLEHNSKDIVKATILESWIKEDSTYDKSLKFNYDLPVGTWFISAKIEDQKVWDKYIKKGKVKGFSVEGMFSQELAGTIKPEDLVEPGGSETEDEFISRCMGVLVGDEGYDQSQAAAICYAKWENKMSSELEGVELNEQQALQIIKELLLESYSDYGDDIKNNAKRGIELNERNGNKCATQTGKVRAQQLANGEPISVETIQRMYSYLSRAETYYDETDTTACGTISYLLWGGKSALSWSRNKLRELGLLEE